MCYLIIPFKSYTTWKGSSKSSKHTLISYNIIFSKTRKRFWRWEGSGLIPEAQHGRIFFLSFFFLILVFQCNDKWASKQAETHKKAVLQLCLYALVLSLFVFPGEWGQSTTRLPTKPGFSLPKVILLRHNTDLSCNFAKMKTGKGSLGIRIMSRAHRN